MPNSRWLKVGDKDTSKVIGGAEWMVHETNPFETPQPALPAYWFPKVLFRRFAETRKMANTTWLNRSNEDCLQPYTAIILCRSPIGDESPTLAYVSLLPLLVRTSH